MSLVKRYSKQLIGFAGFSSLLVLWQLAGFLNILPKFVLPTPLEIGNAFVRDRALS
jgi:hydroxymethylpyrimidine ABC superfamily ATP binding cassette transporter, membrane protein